MSTKEPANHLPLRKYRSLFIVLYPGLEMVETDTVLAHTKKRYQRPIPRDVRFMLAVGR